MLLERFGHVMGYWLVAGGLAAIGVVAATVVSVKEHKEEAAEQQAEKTDTAEVVSDAAAEAIVQTPIALLGALFTVPGGASAALSTARLLGRNYPLVLLLVLIGALSLSSRTMPEQPSWRAAISTVHLLHRASHSMDEIFLRTVGGYLTPRQFVILDAVAEAEGLNQVAITQATGIDRSSTAELVQRLMRRGLLRRRRAKRDVRSYSVRLTQAGKELLETMRPAAERMDRTLVKRFGSVTALRRLVEQ